MMTKQNKTDEAETSQEVDPIQYSFIKKMTKRTSDKRNNKHEWWNDKIKKF